RGLRPAGVAAEFQRSATKSREAIRTSPSTSYARRVRLHLRRYPAQSRTWGRGLAVPRVRSISCVCPIARYSRSRRSASSTRTYRSLSWTRRRASLARLPTTQNVDSARVWTRGDVSRFARQRVPTLGWPWVDQSENVDAPR